MIFYYTNFTLTERFNSNQTETNRFLPQASLKGKKQQP